MFIENVEYICSDGFVDMQGQVVTGVEGYVLNNIVMEKYCVYLYKHKTLFNSEPVQKHTKDNATAVD